MVAKILDGKQIAKDYRQGLQDQVEALKEKGFTPKLSVILVGNDGASQSYVRSKKKAAEKIGMISEIVHLEETATEEEVLNELNRLNNDDSVSGILVQVPLPKQVSEQKILEAINPEKDVDGFHPINIGKLYIDEQTFVPCTPLGIMEILKHADVIVSAVGKPGLVTKDVVKEGAVIIDVGNTPDENGKLKGDVDYDAVKEIAGAITPVPGGVGPLTITMVLNNTLLAEKMRRGIDS
ncbi:tetrahydrofolate dehydrogenase/cyclohydrolase catalytic domain-containing protein [Staphylococcus aureus]|nr:tetrahydrofolate dehydrogenase/cyclohydrolase catalytic domain-containing protein [Staphylococcus aureus]